MGQTDEQHPEQSRRDHKQRVDLLLSGNGAQPIGCAPVESCECGGYREEWFVGLSSFLLPFTSRVRLIQCGADQTAEERVGAVRAAFKLRVVLDAHEEGMAAQLHRLNQLPIRGETGEREPRVGQGHAVGVVELIAVAVPLGDPERAIAAGHGGVRPDAAGPGAEPKRAALVDIFALAGHEVDDLVFTELIELPGVCARDPCDVAGKLNHRHLHAEADAEIGNTALPGILCGENHPLHTAAAEAAGDEDARRAGERFADVLRRQRLGVDPADIHMRIICVTRVAQGLSHGEIGVLQLDVFPDERDGDLTPGGLDLLHHRLPLPEVGRGAGEPKPAADRLGETRTLQHQRRLIEAVQRAVFDHAVGPHVAEQGDLLKDRALQRLVTAQDDDVRVDAHALQFLDGVLGGLGLVLVGAGEIGHQRHMDEETVFPSDLQGHLARRLQKGLALDVADGAADLGDDHVRLRLPADAVDELLDLVGDVGDDLHRGAQVLAPALLVEDVPVDLAGGEIGEAVQILVDKALIVAQIQIGLRPVLGDVDLPVLVGTHGAGIHVDVGIQLLGCDLEAAGFQKSAERRRRDPLAEARHDTAGHKNILGHSISSR